MALRNKDEHSYRTLAIDALRNEVKRGLEQAGLGIGKTPQPPYSNEQRASLVSGVVYALDYLHAIRWLKDLPQELCPESEALVVTMTKRLDDGADFSAIMEELIEETKQFPINDEGSIDV